MSIYDWLLSFSRGTLIEANRAPAVNAGSDQIIKLSTNTLNLSGTASDSDGTIEVHRWSKLSGPGCAIQNEFSTSTTVSKLVQGTYVFRFWAKDNDGAAAYDDVMVIVQGDAANKAPVVSAGSNQAIQLPTNTLKLTGTARDSDGTIEVYRWSKLSGPDCAIQNEFSTSTTVSKLVQGTYVFRFWAKDNDGAAAYDDVTAIVQGDGANKAPLVSAGSDQAIQLPANTLNLSGMAKDSDGTIEVYRWSKLSGPGCEIQNEFSPSTTVTNLVRGTYVFRFWTKDNDGAAAYDDMTAIVQGDGANKAPIVSAGSDRTIQLPINTLNLSGTVRDSDGTIEVYRWSKQSGPDCAIQNEFSTSTTISNLVQGTYVFRFWAKDNDGAAAYDDVIINVNQAPLVSAGADKTIHLPSNSVVLNGITRDSDGNIEVNRWTKQSGPSCAIQSEYSASTTVTNLVRGTYVFRFWAKDNHGAAAYDDVTIRVNQAPVVNAGSDKTIQLPSNSLILNGKVSGADGNIEVKRWTKQSGPSCTIQSAYSARTTVTNLMEGTYVFRFWAKDNDGAAAYDDVTVIVQNSSNAGARISGDVKDFGSLNVESAQSLVYPIPARNNILHVYIPKDLSQENGDPRISICNLAGKEIVNRPLEIGKVNDIDLTGMISAVYIYTINLGERTITRNKLIKN